MKALHIDTKDCERNIKIEKIFQLYNEAKESV